MEFLRSFLGRHYAGKPVASHADVHRGSLRVPAPRDEPLRTPAWEAREPVAGVVVKCRLFF